MLSSIQDNLSKLCFLPVALDPNELRLLSLDYDKS